MHSKTEWGADVCCHVPPLQLLPVAARQPRADPNWHFAAEDLDLHLSAAPWDSSGKPRLKSAANPSNLG